MPQLKMCQISTTKKSEEHLKNDFFKCKVAITFKETIAINHIQNWAVTDNIWCIQFMTKLPIKSCLHTLDPPLLLPTNNVQILWTLWKERKSHHWQKGKKSKQTQKIVPCFILACSSTNKNQLHTHLRRVENTMP